MTEQVTRLKEFFIEKKMHRRERREGTDPYAQARLWSAQGMSDIDRAIARLVYMLDQEEPIIYPGQRIVFLRSNPTLPVLFTEHEKEEICSRRRIHESGELSNICVDYTRFLGLGFTGMRSLLSSQMEKYRQSKRTEQENYLNGELMILDSLTRLITRYKDKAVDSGFMDVSDSLSRLLYKAPDTLRDALQMQRILHFTLWCSGSYHNTLGRFDQYMLPYLVNDLAAGRLDEESALDLLEEFFLTFNLDSDLYPGMQQGDNGQSMVLGGMTPDGKDGFNPLSQLCLRASLELRLIDPKINLRVSSSTPLPIYKLGTQLTKQGLGFPQYTNDDIMIPGLEELGYTSHDARNYAIAACWELIIPGRGMEVPNIDALCFASVVRDTIISRLTDVENYEDLWDSVKHAIVIEVERLCKNTRDLYIFPSPFASLMMEGCIEKGQDITLGGVYNNYGLHGTGLATAADSLAAVKKYVFETAEVDRMDLLSAMENNFAGQERLLHLLRYEAPKLGNNEDLPDSIACGLLNTFSEAVKGRFNDRGGIFRAGTGSAMYYLWYSKDLGATPDGRRAGEGFSCNYSPSLFIHSAGPVSIVKSFSKPDLKHTVNGGPLTIELHDTLFRSPESITKVAALVKSYIDLGGHQMQINAVNRETMLDAQLHPDDHRNLIVRVWGWSGYFVELDKEYQDHIIKRVELSL